MKPKTDLWIIFDPLDGPHLFSNEDKAKKTLKKWQNDAEGMFDFVFDMTGPFHYILKKEK